jgi:hypothetical protein
MRYGRWGWALLFLTSCFGPIDRSQIDIRDHDLPSGGLNRHTNANGVLSPVSVSSNSTFVDVYTPQQFFATVNGEPEKVSWFVDDVLGGSRAVGTISASGLYTPSTSGTHTVKAVSNVDAIQSGSASLTVVPFGVYTFHDNLSRDGVNSHESVLTPTNVNTATFGKLFSCPVDGVVYAQPLWVPALNIDGSAHNVVFVVTQHDTAFAFDADANSCVQLWRVNLLDQSHGDATGETSVPSADVGFNIGNIQPEIGVTGTPVIDAATNTMYLVAKSLDAGGAFHMRLHALSLLDGSEKFLGPIDISTSIDGSGAGESDGGVAFDARTANQRSGLTLVNGVVYVPWAAHEDADPYHGWVIGFDAGTLAQVSQFNVTPNGTRGGIWMGGGAPAADDRGNLYLLTGNGTYDGTASNDFGDSALKLSRDLSVTDWFTPYNQAALETSDSDLASSALLLLPDQAVGPTHLLVASGKEGRVYLIDRDDMGHICSTCTATDTNIVQSFLVASNFSAPAFWENALYIAAVDFPNNGDFLKRFVFAAGKGFTTAPASQSSNRFPYPGAHPSVSSDGANNGIVWAIDASQFGSSGSAPGPAVLHAYDATNLANELWNSSLAANGRDQAGLAVKYTAPTIVNGRVYLSTRTEIDVFGLLPLTAQP